MFIDGNEVIVSGKLVKIVQFREEWDVDVEDPEFLIEKIKASGIKADIFTFQQRLPDSKPKFSYTMEWDNIAALPITNYDHWFKSVLHQNPRNKIRIARKKGVEIRTYDFNDETLNQMMSIYHENPFRQGVPFSHYNMSFERAKKANSTFLDRATFVGAYYKDELIGFIKLVSTGKRSIRTMGILSKIAHRDKAPMNLLIAKSVEICAQKNYPYLTYGKYSYGKVGSSTLQNFKLYFGFESIILPRYYIPLNKWGEIIIKLKLHREVKQLLPLKLVRFLLFLRGKWNEKRYEQYLKNTEHQ